MNSNKPEYEETERMRRFRRRKEKELRRRRRNKRIAAAAVILIIIGIAGTCLRSLPHLLNRISGSAGSDAAETDISTDSDLVQISGHDWELSGISPESGQTDTSAQESAAVSECETKEDTEGEKEIVTTEVEKTQEPDAGETDVTTETDAKNKKEYGDPREDVWTHYTNMFIASKVDSYVNVRDQPSTDGTIIGKLTKYSGGELLEDLGNGWWHVRTGGIEGYIWAELCVTGDEAKEVALEHCIQMVEVTTEKLNVRSGPGLEYEVWTTLNASEKQVVEERDGDWLKIAFNSSYGYISAEFVKTGYYLVEAVPWSSISDCSPARQQLLTYGEQFIGTQYVYGGTSLTGGIDCSSFVQQCFANTLGISLPRTSREQAECGTVISLAEAKPGDLLFYADATGTINHVVFYLGDGKILHAARSLGQITISKYNYSAEPVRVVNIIGD